MPEDTNAQVKTDPSHDYLIARGVVACLGAIGLTIAVGSITAACFNVEVPGEVMGLGGTAVGALSALLSRVNK